MTIKSPRSLIGSQIAKYKILEKIGEGGMGVVYKASDTRLERNVALKILSPQSVPDEEALARFLREAKASAALNHPNICTLYEAEETDNNLYFAMEFLEGQTLKILIEERPLPLEKALDIATQVSEGVRAAHQKGIIHRDIKPGNIVITQKGEAKILDFGLAQRIGASQLTHSGMVLGTPAYMSPEQIQGDKVDERTDIWALGVLIYVMLAGRLPFKGQSNQGLAYQIVNNDPEPLTALRSGIPMDIDHILAKAMAKKPAERYQHVDDMLVDLKALIKKLPSLSTHLKTTGFQKAQDRKTWTSFIPWLGALVLGLLLVLFLWQPWKTAPTKNPLQVTRFVVPLPEGDLFKWVGIFGSAIDISPDGKEVIYAAVRGNNRQLFRRTLSDLEPIPIPDTQGALAPILSRDSSWITYVTGREVKRVHVSSGVSSALGKINEAAALFNVDIAFFGGCWLSDNDLLLSECSRGLRLFSLDSGQKKEITNIVRSFESVERQHQFPQILPGKKWVLFTIWNSATDSKIAVRSLETGEQKIILQPGSYARYSPSGYLVYAWQGDLYAAPFELSGLEVTGKPIKVIEGVLMQESRGAAHFSLSENGSLVYIPGPYLKDTKKLAWVDLKGNIERLDFPVPDRGVRLSPDGKKALATHMTDTGNAEIWIFDLERGTSQPLTDPEAQSYWAVWSHDGKKIVFNSSYDNLKNLTLYQTSADGSSSPAPEQLLPPEGLWEMAYSWDPQGKLLAFQRGKDVNPSKDWDIWILPMDGERKPYPLIQTPNMEIHPAISPDGRWLAYASKESEFLEVRIRPLSGAGPVIQVSPKGGWEPVWSPDGKTLYYRSSYSRMMAVTLDAGPILRVSKPVMVFENDELEGGYIYGRNFDISPDGQRFLMISVLPPPPPPKEFIVVVNWIEELKSHFLP